MKTINEITEFQNAKMTKNNFWLIELLYGDAADDKTATFQIPANITFNKKK